MSEEVQFGPITFVPGLRSGRYPYCHSLFIDGQTRVLLDPSSDKDRLLEIRDDPGVDSVWLSHAHEDHMTYLDLFEDAELWVHEEDAPAMASMDSFLDAYGVGQGDHRERWARIMEEVFRFRPRTPDRLFKGSQLVNLGGVTVEVIHTPGHTPGHCAFYFREEQLLFLGDYDLSPFGPWYGDVNSSIEQTIESVERLRKIPAKVWITGHENGPIIEGVDYLFDGYLQVIARREERLLELLKSPKTIDEIVDARIIYGEARLPEDFILFGERAHMEKHLERLIREGIVTRQGRLYALT